MEERTVKASHVHMTELVLPNDTNQLGNLFGGRLMQWVDIAASIAAQRHSGRLCVTASLDELNFHLPIRLGEVVTLRASVNRVFRTSMEVGVLVTAQGLGQTSTRRATNAYLTLVALDETGIPTPIPGVVPESEDEKRRYQDANDRRQERLSRRRRS